VQTTGFIVGPLLFQVFSSRTPLMDVDHMRFAAKFDLRTICPIGGEPITRPAQAHDRDGFQIISNDFVRDLRVPHFSY
jgi:hypothetical protein